MTGSSTQEIESVPHPVSDHATARAVHVVLLGVPPETEGSTDIGFEAAGQHIGLVPRGRRHGTSWPAAYWPVPDIEAKLAGVAAVGAINEPRFSVLTLRIESL